MPSNYPAGHPVYPAHGTNMDDPPLHNDVHLQHEQDIVAITGELGLNPSGVHSTLVTRLSSIETNVTNEVNARVGGDTYLENDYLTRIAAKTSVSSLVGGAGPANYGLQIRTGSTVVTLDGFGTATVNFGAAFPTGFFDVVVCCGDTQTANQTANPGIITKSSTGVHFSVQRAGGATATGSFRLNFVAIGLS